VNAGLFAFHSLDCNDNFDIRESTCAPKSFDFLALVLDLVTPYALFPAASELAKHVRFLEILHCLDRAQPKLHINIWDDLSLAPKLQ